MYLGYISKKILVEMYHNVKYLYIYEFFEQSGRLSTVYAYYLTKMCLVIHICTYLKTIMEDLFMSRIHKFSAFFVGTSGLRLT